MELIDLMYIDTQFNASDDLYDACTKCFLATKTSIQTHVPYSESNGIASRVIDPITNLLNRASYSLKNI